MESVYARIPGLIVVAPSTPAEAKGLLKSAIRCDDPVIFLESEKMLDDDRRRAGRRRLHAAARRRQRRAPGQRRHDRQLRPPAPARRPPGGRARWSNDHGIDVELIDVRTLRPLDVNTIVESVKKTNRCVIVDEDWGYCGMGSGILYKLQKPCFDYLDAPIEYVHSDEIPVPFNHYLEEAMMPSVDRIVAAVKEVCYR